MNKKIVRTLREEIEALRAKLVLAKSSIFLDQANRICYETIATEIERILSLPEPEGATILRPEEIDGPAPFDMGNGDHWQAAIDLMIDAREAAAEALTRAITPQAHFELCAIVTNQTATLQRLELARKADAS